MRVLSGIKPTGKLHLGNYFGAVRQFIDFQEKYNDIFVFVANYHALTTMPDPKENRERTLDIMLDYLALGLDPKKVTLFLQSDVPELCELTWFLTCVTPMGLLERGHSYKDKMAKEEAVNHGVFAYPVLMASDILIYQSNLVPVGKDQKQHIEIARDIAIKFNNTYGEVFTIPEDRIVENVAVVPGTDGRKMSKSYDNTIEVFATPKKTKEAVMRIVTDSTPLEEPKNPDGCNVIALYKLFATAAELEAMKANYRGGNYGYGHAKMALNEKINEYFAPFREKRIELAAKPDYVADVVHEGGKRARAIAIATLKKARDAMGILEI